VRLPSARGERLSVLAAMDAKGFFAWGHTFGTFSRKNFHETFATKIVPYLNPWPLPRSIVILDNAKIHMYEELQELVSTTGALLFFLPPYSPDLNPIEVGFSLLKRWVQRHASFAFKEAPVETMEVALRECTKRHEQVGYGLYRHCGYFENALNISL
jgi:transposase